MIHHASIGVRNPAQVAQAIAELTGGNLVRAPTPPFPHRAWFIVFGDAFGSLLEVLPATSAFHPDTPLGLSQQEARTYPASTHVLLSAAVDEKVIAAVAEREGWRVQEVETGLFRVIKLWIDEVVLVELLTEDEIRRYAAAFGASGLPALDDRLRDLEAGLAKALAAKLSAEQLAAILGQPV